MGETGLGKRINETRKNRGFTAERLSELCGINATYLRQIEGGTKTPSLPIFIKLCNALETSPDYLLKDSLDNNEISSIREIETLWETAAPDTQKLILAVIKAVIENKE